MRRGVYSLPNQAVSENRSLAEVAIRVPRGVICLVSALRVHDIGTQAPHEIWLAIPHRMLTPRLDKPALRVIRMSGPSLTEGIDRLKVDGVNVPVFNAAKTIADRFKFHNKIGLDVALEVLREGWNQRMVTTDDLRRYAVINRASNVMHSLFRIHRGVMSKNRASSIRARLKHCVDAAHWACVDVWVANL